MSRFVSIFAGVGWALAIVCVLLLERARPAGENFFSRVLESPMPNTWNKSLLRFSLVVLIAVVCVCVIGFFFNMARSRRKTDKFNKSIIFLGVASSIGLAHFVFSFSQHL